MLAGAGSGEVSSVRFLLDAGVSPSFEDDSGVTPGAAVVSTREDDFVPDHEPARLATLKRLASAGADLSVPNSDGSTLLHQCAGGSYPQICRYLIGHGLRVNARTAAGETPLMSAAISRRPIETLRLLLSSGANPTLRNVAGMTAQQLAAGAGNSEAAALLRAAK
jgi:ankyrin repeat protein